MRERYIDSTMQTIDRLSPRVSMHEIAAEAKFPKPTFHRFFRQQVGLGQRDQRPYPRHGQRDIPGCLQRPDTTGGQFVREVLHSYLDVVLKRPNIFRFLVLMMSRSGDARRAGAAAGKQHHPEHRGRGGSVDDLAGRHRDEYRAGLPHDRERRDRRDRLVASQHTAGRAAENFVDHVEKYVRATLLETVEANGLELETSMLRLRTCSEQRPGRDAPSPRSAPRRDPRR